MTKKIHDNIRGPTRNVIACLVSLNLVVLLFVFIGKSYVEFYTSSIVIFRAYCSWELQLKSAPLTRYLAQLRITENCITSQIVQVQYIKILTWPQGFLPKNGRWLRPQNQSVFMTKKNHMTPSEDQRETLQLSLFYWVWLFYCSFLSTNPT